MNCAVVVVTSELMTKEEVIRIFGGKIRNTEFMFLAEDEALLCSYKLFLKHSLMHRLHACITHIHNIIHGLTDRQST